ncbi:nicotinate-nucleotide--dimethylbenzimidazole phosphoribosyltransferase [Pleionea litopenaei]|uniref:Nicotinate-nucleotide--dimethylbenzimidazole phosphoribosyltransferase n=1 Tax=Pleionea litopenaei TaxID=3070815 RepID=A0AA51X5U1_9GAMM|nr:nicotinate-nucleotide--dimethylbenzimidazole phosphoribosyltransferase [Pleionea sp. HL-JVS1]WMS86081.1 nicotinate-nucleotide--dimethylbenzimidazole phosphoribosyltransferase [Pleionea sp. HL-JVS1]
MFTDSFNISSLDRQHDKSIRMRIDQKTKPPGSLGQLETLATQLASILGPSSITIQAPRILVFAADHGIAEEGVSIAPSSVTAQMVLNFLHGGAAINCFCRSSEIELSVIDAGIMTAIDHPDLIQQAIARGTQNFSQHSAMTRSQAEQALLAGHEIAQTFLRQGCNTLGFGEMGIGNTSSAAAMMAALLKIPADECVGRGTGITDEALQRKLNVVARALQLHAQQLHCPIDILANLGGFEIGQIAGAMLATAEAKSVILVDGFITTAAALLAQKIAPNVADYMVFCHESNEQGHQRMLKSLSGTPLLNLGMRLGEGTGAALAIPLLRAAASFYNDMASFESAGVSV